MSLPIRSLIVAAAVPLLVALPICSVQAQKAQRDRISREELMNQAQRDKDLYEAIRALRPRFLEVPIGSRSFGASMKREVEVYVDGARQSGFDTLKGLRASNVDEVRYLDPTSAETELGPSANGGAILVKIHKPGKDAARDTTPRGQTTP